MRNSLILLNENGDTTISWDETNDDKMIALIEKKIKEGMTFFIVEPRIMGMFPMKKKLVSADDSLKQRMVIVTDADFNDILLNGTADAYKREDNSPITVTGVLKTAKEAVNKHLVGVTQRVGG